MIPPSFLLKSAPLTCTQRSEERLPLNITNIEDFTIYGYEIYENSMEIWRLPWISAQNTEDLVQYWNFTNIWLKTKVNPNHNVYRDNCFRNKIQTILDFLLFSPEASTHWLVHRDLRRNRDWQLAIQKVYKIKNFRLSYWGFIWIYLNPWISLKSTRIFPKSTGILQKSKDLYGDSEDLSECPKL